MSTRMVARCFARIYFQHTAYEMSMRMTRATMSTDKTDLQEKGQQAGSHDSEIYEERRRYPRFLINRRSTIRETSGNIFHHAIAHDISEDGLQIRCDHATAYTLYPSDDEISGDEAPEVDVRLSLPLREGLVELSAHCRTVHKSVIPEDGVAFGLRFIEFTGDTAGNLVKFIEESVHDQ